MKIEIKALTLAAMVVLAGCSATSSSRAFEPSAVSPSQGPVFVSQNSIPAELGHKVLGSVKANARTGTDRVEKLYPLLAEEARKMDANAVFNARGGHAPAAFSWAAPFVTGQAVRVDDPEKLKGIAGSFY